MACEKVSESFPQEISVQLDKIIKTNHSGLQKFTKWEQQIKKCFFSKTVEAEDKNSKSLWPSCLSCSHPHLRSYQHGAGHTPEVLLPEGANLLVIPL